MTVQRLITASLSVVGRPFHCDRLGKRAPSGRSVVHPLAAQARGPSFRAAPAPGGTAPTGRLAGGGVGAWRFLPVAPTITVMVAVKKNATQSAHRLHHRYECDLW